MTRLYRLSYYVLTTVWLCLVLSGCRAMETRHTDGSKFPDDQGPYYVEGKKATFGRRSYASVWQSGSLAGACEATELAEGHPLSVVDNVLFEVSTLFETASSSLNEHGKRVLEQLYARIQQYENVRYIELHGHADVRGSESSNQTLSEKRIAEVKAYLVSQMPADVEIREFAFGESRSLMDDVSEQSLQNDRRVVVRVSADGVKRESSARSLCKTAGRKRVRLDGNGHVVHSDNLLIHDFPMVLSMGDRVRLRVVEDPDIDGIYEISNDGALDIPYAGKVSAVGFTVQQLEKKASRKLVTSGVVKPGFAKLDIAILQWSAADVFVSGAVFVPGRKTINGLNVDTRNFKQTQVSGDWGRERMLSSALSSAGGIRPDADLHNIRVRRNGREEIVDLSGVISGRPAADFPLINGDSVEVPSSGVFQESLVRVSQITPPGIRIFISNLSVPTQSNALSAVSKDASSMPYGSRFLDALLSANCVGGTQYTNSARRAVLIGTNQITGQTEVIERNIQQLVSDPDRDQINPYLMPNDGVACYDSEVSNIRDVARVFSEVLSPLSFLKTLLE